MTVTILFHIVIYISISYLHSTPTFIEFYNIQIYFKGSLTEEQKKQIKLLQDAVSTMKPLYEGLEEAVKKLKDNIISYGTILVKLGSKEEKVEVIDVVAHLIMDGLAQMQQAQDSMKDGIDGLTVMSLTQLSNNVSMTTKGNSKYDNINSLKGT